MSYSDGSLKTGRKQFSIRIQVHHIVSNQGEK